MIESDPLMKFHSKVAMAAAAGAMVLASSAPAAARGYDGRWGRYPQHHRNHDNSGAVIGAILGVGLLAAIASSASRQREAQQGYRVPRPGERGYDPRYDERDYRSSDNDRGYADNRGYDDAPYSSNDYAQVDENAAVDACALAARDEASRSGDFAEVRDITGARPFGNGWDVTGTVSQRASFSSADSRVRSFRCIWDSGRVDGVTFG